MSTSRFGLRTATLVRKHGEGGDLLEAQVVTNTNYANDPLLGEALSLELTKHGTFVGNDGRFLWCHDPLHVTPGPYGFEIAVAQRFWKKIRFPFGMGAANCATIFRQSVSPEAITSSAMGCFLPVAPR